jgi:hypothetical protein
MANDATITAALARGVRQALRRHQQAGIPAVEWRAGKIAQVQPGQLSMNGGQGRPKTKRRPRPT